MGCINKGCCFIKVSITGRSLIKPALIVNLGKLGNIIILVVRPH